VLGEAFGLALAEGTPALAVGSPASAVGSPASVRGSPASVRGSLASAAGSLAFMACQMGVGTLQAEGRLVGSVKRVVSEKELSVFLLGFSC